MKNISIIVAGTANSGKSNIAQIIKEALVKQGIRTFVNDEAKDYNPPSLMGQVEVQLKVIQTKRDLSLERD